MDNKRRRFLKFSGAVIGASVTTGCLGDEGNSDQTPGSKQTPESEQTPANSADDNNGGETPVNQDNGDETPSDRDDEEGTNDATPTPDNESEEGEPRIELRGVSAPKTALSGDTMTVRATIENRGDATGTGLVTTTFDGNSEPHETTELAPDDVDVMSMDLEIDDSTTGKQKVAFKADETERYETVDVFEVDVGVYGVLIGPNGDRLSGHEVVVIHHTREGNKEYRVEADDDGHFQVKESGPTVSLDVIKPKPGESNGFPVLYRVFEQKYSRDHVHDVGHVDVPKGYHTSVQLVDSDGDPVSNFDAVNFRTATYGTKSQGSFTTTSEGYVIVEGAETDGIIAPIESDGPLQVVGDDERKNYVQLGSVFGSPDGNELTIEVENPDEFEQ